MYNNVSHIPPPCSVPLIKEEAFIRWWRKCLMTQVFQTRARLETDGSLLVEKQALSKDQNIFVCTGSG